MARPIYRGGNFDELWRCLAGIIPENKDEEGSWNYWQSWLEWRKKEYKNALDLAVKAIECGDRRGWEIVAYYAAHVSKDDAALNAALKQLDSDNPVVINAVLIRAKDADCAMGAEDILAFEGRIKGTPEQAANCWNNGGLALLKKARTSDDVKTGIVWINKAIELYHEVGIDHHLAGAYFRRSLLEESLGDRIAAKESMRLSVYHWEEACGKFKNNESFANNLASNRKRYAGLMVVAFVITLAQLPNCLPEFMAHVVTRLIT